jgi:hypothetical protein
VPTIDYQPRLARLAMDEDDQIRSFAREALDRLAGHVVASAGVRP